MYSLVLMATMTSPAMVPDCHRNRCSGGYGRGCHGSFYGGCHGGGYGGCHGGGYGGGCYGGGGGCYGSSYYYGGSCYGGHGGYGCTGHYGCSGGVQYGGAVYGGTGYGAPSYYGGAPAGGGVMTAPAPAPSGAPATAPAPAPGGGAGDRPRGEQGVNLNAPAHIFVSLPADAKLYVDGQLTKTTDKADRSFLTPDLDAGVEYRYTMKAEVIRDGQTQSETKTLIVRAGAVVREEFGSLMTITTASNR